MLRCACMETHSDHWSGTGEAGRIRARQRPATSFPARRNTRLPPASSRHCQLLWSIVSPAGAEDPKLVRHRGDQPLPSTPHPPAPCAEQRLGTQEQPRFPAAPSAPNTPEHPLHAAPAPAPAALPQPQLLSSPAQPPRCASSSTGLRLTCFRLERGRGQRLPGS